MNRYPKATKRAKPPVSREKRIQRKYATIKTPVGRDWSDAYHKAMTLRVPRTPGREHQYEFECLRDLLVALPQNHPVRRAFDDVDDNYIFDWEDDQDMDMEMLAGRVHAFYTMLSELEQRIVLNGWRPKPDRPVITSPEAQREKGSVEFYVEVSRDCRNPGDVTGYGYWDSGSTDTYPVTLRIRENRTKREVVEFLRQSLGFVDSHWDAIADCEPDGKVQVEERAKR